MTGQNPDAGWYRDPAGSGERWWDGERWTGATRDAMPSPTPPPVEPPTEEPPRPKQTNKRRIAIASVAGVVVIGAAAAIVLPRVLGGGDTYTVTGTVEVPAPDWLQYPREGQLCTTDGGYDDIAVGKQVRLTADGETLAVGSLGAGKLAGATSEQPMCVFEFTLPEAKVTSDFVEIDLGRRGAVTYERERLLLPIGLTLG